MSALQSSARGDDGRLWAIALGASLLGNAVIIIVAGFMTLKSRDFSQALMAAEAEVKESESVVRILPEMIQAERVPAPEAPAEKEEKSEKSEKAAAAPPAPAVPRVQPPEGVARTSEDQRSERPQRPRLMGERDTTATSDRPPDPNAPDLPSQAGMKPLNDHHLETTESKYQDGKLDAGKVAVADAEPFTPASPESMVPPAPAPEPSPNFDPAMAEQPTVAKAAEPATRPAEAAGDPPPLREKLLTGPNPVDVPVYDGTGPKKSQARPEPRPELPKETADKRDDTAVKGNAADKPQQAPKTTPRAKNIGPEFKGNQRKTAIRGSISRTGRSSLDVADSPLGRYQAVISRAVELEWQRNCVRHRDLITPGYLTVRFFVESSGRVRSVQFVGAMSTGEVQKGFTLNSIRDAEIPAMPDALKADYSDEPLELIFNFYF